ncbi:MAG: bifunctional phosphoribosylaminoimidazolecarboxamide formyltransferase/IMP cyclohydrolase [Xanthomonadales bacterium]|nr:bifunctional phosphoribosylaminoimidazolecarboxamide formyltransferase/IMP cyclohydrolase [Xanthomonadales bacterium]
MSSNHKNAKRYALLSVSDKSGLAEFADALAGLGFTLLSTGGTARALREAGLAVRDVSEHTGFPEIMDGRVKTLHPRIHGGILGRPGDEEIMREHGIEAIELVVVNLYPFESVIARQDCTRALAIENIDIGGPAMVRAAAKNHARVGVITDPADYGEVLDELRDAGSLAAATRSRLAARAFAHTARYDARIAAYLAAPGDEPAVLPARHEAAYDLVQPLRYGENPHQVAGFYTVADASARLESLQGKPLSYNNIADADAALECVGQFDERPACIIVKHANPCGGATADSTLEAYRLAYATDPTSSFGGVIAFNRALDEATASAIIETQFVEVIVAPAYDNAALRALAAKPNVRVLVATPGGEADRLDYHRVGAGMLIQHHDALGPEMPECRVASRRQPTAAERSDLAFAWKMVRLVKSNAIVYARDNRTLGIGAGQMSRVDSARIAAWKAVDAGLSLAGAAMASDAFFPFRDSIDTAAEAGIRAVIQPGGSMRDEEVIAAADEHDMVMLLTGRRHFRH